MKPFILLISIFIVGLLIKIILKKNIKTNGWIARFAMCCMLIFTGISHFVFAKGMIEMLPSWISFRPTIIYITGGLEIIGAIGLLFKRSSKLAAILLIVFMVCVLPANIYSALHNIDPMTGLNDGHGLSYLLFRIPLQLFFIAWLFISTIKSNH